MVQESQESFLEVAHDQVLAVQWHSRAASMRTNQRLLHVQSSQFQSAPTHSPQSSVEPLSSHGDASGQTYLRVKKHCTSAVSYMKEIRCERSSTADTKVSGVGRGGSGPSARTEILHRKHGDIGCPLAAHEGP